jgi:hypothetical protein
MRHNATVFLIDRGCWDVNATKSHILHTFISNYCFYKIYWLLAAGCWLLAAGCWLLVTGYM